MDLVESMDIQEIIKLTEILTLSATVTSTLMGGSLDLMNLEQDFL